MTVRRESAVTAEGISRLQGSLTAGTKRLLGNAGAPGYGGLSRCFTGLRLRRISERYLPQTRQYFTSSLGITAAGSAPYTFWFPLSKQLIIASGFPDLSYLSAYPCIQGPFRKSSRNCSQTVLKRIPAECHALPPASYCAPRTSRSKTLREILH